MGFSVSGSVVVIFLALLIAIGAFVPTLIGGFQSVSSSQVDQIDRGNDASNTDYNIQSVTFDTEDESTELVLQNTGTTQLEIGMFTYFIDGNVQLTAEDINSISVNGEVGAQFLYPTDQLIVEFNTPNEPDRIKIVSENGVEKLSTDIITA